MVIQILGVRIVLMPRHGLGGSRFPHILGSEFLYILLQGYLSKPYPSRGVPFNPEYVSGIIVSRGNHNLLAERESGGKGDSDKSQYNPFVWDRDTFKLSIWLEKTYA